MPDHGEHIAENLLNNIMETFNDSKPKTVKFFDEGSSVSTQMNKLFGRQKSVHKILGGGKCMQSSRHFFFRKKFFFLGKFRNNLFDLFSC